MGTASAGDDEPIWWGAVAQADPDQQAPVQAGEPEPEPAAQKKPAGIEEITVTARKREESLQATPVAISAFSETDLKDQDIRQVDDITANVPSLQFDKAIGGASSARIYLRGVGTGDPIASRDPGVGIYVDGVFLPRSQGALLTVSDVAQIEVLRGPQGTLFGKNTIGGAVNITSKKPDPSEFGGNAEIRVGNYKRFDTRLAVNVPLIPEKAAARFSLATATRDAFAKNKSTGRDLGNDKLLGGRAQFLLLPSDNSELNFSIDASRENRTPSGGKCVVSNFRPRSNAPGTTNTTTGVGATNGTEVSGGQDLNMDGIIQNAPSAIVFAATNGVTRPDGTVGQAELLTQFGILQSITGMTAPSIQNGFNGNRLAQACQRDRDRDERSVASDLSSYKDHLSTFGTNLTYTYDFEGGMTLKAITSFRQQIQEARAEADYTELNFAQSTLDDGDLTERSYSQELQLTGTGLDDRFKYVVGLYAFQENNESDAFGGLSTDSQFASAGALAFVDPQTGQTVRFGTAAGSQNAAVVARINNRNAQFGRPGVTDFLGAGLPPALLAASALGQTSVAALPGAITRTDLKVNNRSIGAYTQGTYDLTDQLSATVGLRLTSERKRVFNEIRAVTGGFVGSRVRLPDELDFAFESSQHSKDLSPLINLSYQATDDLLFYTTFSKGFKSGGFNGRANDPSLTGEISDEKLTSYEFGVKSTFFDNRLQLNAATYFSRYKDIQLTIPRGINGQAAISILNAGAADIRGGELEMRALPIANLDLGASLGVVNSRYTEFDDPQTQFAKDRRLLATPTYTANFSAGYTIPAGSMGDFRVRGEWKFRGRSGTDVSDSPELRKSKSGELDAQLAWAMADGKTELVLFGNNLLNREFFVNGVNLGDSLGIAYRFFNDPRTYGLEIRRQF